MCLTQRNVYCYISNHRIIRVSKSHVTFRYLDRKANQSRTKTLPGEDFIRLFAEHILPKGFVKIRHIGFLASRSKKENLAKARDSLGVPAAPPKHKVTTREIMQMTTGKDPYLCPACGKGEMVIITIIPPIRGSPVQKIFRSIPWDRKVFFGVYHSHA